MKYIVHFSCIVTQWNCFIGSLVTFLSLFILVMQCCLLYTDTCMLIKITAYMRPMKFWYSFVYLNWIIVGLFTNIGTLVYGLFGMCENLSRCKGIVSTCVFKDIFSLLIVRVTDSQLCRLDNEWYDVSTQSNLFCRECIRFCTRFYNASLQGISAEDSINIVEHKHLI